MSGKEEIREKLKIKRRYFYGVRREVADGCIKDNFLAAFSSCDSFFIYNSFSAEADTSAIINALVSAGKNVFLPRTEGENMVAVAYSEDMKKGSFGILEPIGEPYGGQIDVTVLPLLAVNENGFRIGYGKGFYDKFLKDRHTLKVGLGYSFQIEKFSADGWDVPLDFFVCEKGIYTYGNDGQQKKR